MKGVFTTMKYKKGKIITYSLIIVALLAVITVAVTVGLGNGYGSASNINLGLDLAGGVSITYEIQEDNPTQQEIITMI